MQTELHVLPRRNLNTGAVVTRRNLWLFRNAVCLLRALRSPCCRATEQKSSSRELSKQKSWQRMFPWLPVLNSQIHRWLISKPKWDAACLHTETEHKFAMVHCPLSQERVSAIIIIYMAETFQWDGLKVSFGGQFI